jgi:hypothetical protein
MLSATNTKVITSSAISVYLFSARYGEQSFCCKQYCILDYKKRDIYFSSFINTSNEEFLTNLWLRAGSCVIFQYIADLNYNSVTLLQRPI